MSLNKLLVAAALAGCGQPEVIQDPITVNTPAKPTPAPKPAETEPSLDRKVIEQSESFRMPFHTAENHGTALVLMENHRELMQEEENELAKADKREPEKIEYSREALFYFGQQINANGIHGVSVAELNQYANARAWVHGIKATDAKSASMELKTQAYAYDSQEDQNRLHELIAEHADDEGVEPTQMFELMVKAHIAKRFGAQKIQTEDGEAVHLSTEVIGKYGTEKPRFPIPGRAIRDLPVEPEEVVYERNATVKCADPTVFALSQAYIRVHNAVQKALGQPAAEDNEAQTHLISRLAGKDGVVQSATLNAHKLQLDEKIDMFRRDSGESHPELDLGEITITSQDTYTSSFSGTMPAPYKRRLEAALDRYGVNGVAGDAYVVSLLKSHNGIATRQDLNGALTKIREDYGAKK